MDSLKKISLLEKHASTFYECSKDDDHGTFMNVPKLPCVNFDNAVSEFTKKMGYDKYSAASADTISISKSKDEKIVLIEFKNGKLKSASKRLNIREKMCNSLLILEAIFNQSWTELRNSMEFILVYNENKNPKEQPKEVIKDKMYNKAAGTSNVRFNLARHYGLYYKRIRTVTENEFSTIVEQEKLTI